MNINLNKSVIVATLVITMSGLYFATIGNKAAANGQTVFRIILGGWVFMLFLSVVDLFGGVGAQIAGGLALLAMVTVLVGTNILADVAGILTAGGKGVVSGFKAGA